MKLRLKIDKNAEEIVEAVVHKRSVFTERLEELCLGYSGENTVTAYTEDDIKVLRFGEIERVTVENGKTYAVDKNGERFRLKLRLYELEQLLPSSFIKINKSSLANKNRIERFSAGFSGSVDVIFKSGESDYVSRRCFAEIKKELKSK